MREMRYKSCNKAYRQEKMIKDGPKVETAVRVLRREEINGGCGLVRERKAVVAV